MYYMFGFLFVVFIILIVTCSEATVLLCYFHLCAEVSINSSHGIGLTYYFIYLYIGLRLYILSFSRTIIGGGGHS